MKLDHPMTLANAIARLLESDPIAAAQVKEHIKPGRLREILEVEPRISDFDTDEILDYVSTHFTRAQVLAAFT